MIGAVSQLLSASAVSTGGLAQPSIASAASSQTAGTDFSQVLAQLSADAVGTIKQGEAMSIEGIEGKASVQQVVESVMSAEHDVADGDRHPRQGRSSLSANKPNGDMRRSE